MNKALFTFHIYINEVEGNFIRSQVAQTKRQAPASGDFPPVRNNENMG